MMRILTLANCPLDESLGSGYVVLNYCQRLRRLGHRVDVYGPADYEPLHRWGRAIQYRQALGMAANALRRAAAGGYDVVEIYGAEGWLAFSLLARKRRRPFLLVAHSNGIEPHCAETLAAAAAVDPAAVPRRPWYQLDQTPLFRKTFRRADAVVTVSEWDRRYAIEKGFTPPERCLALENPLPEGFLGLEPDLDRGPVLGTCGSWLPIKGAAVLRRALPTILRALPAWRLKMVGVGGDFRPRDHFPADVLPRIEVIPFAERGQALRSLYEEMAILLLPSLYESFGLAAAEAMACGCALVATRVGFAADLVDGEEAVTVERPEVDLITAAVLRLAGDDALRRRIARRGFERVQGLRWDDAAAKLAAAYESWLGQHRRGEDRGLSEEGGRGR